MCLRRILYQPQVVALCNVQELLHLGRLTIEMDDENSLGTRRDRTSNLHRINVIGLWVDVHKDRSSADVRNRLRRGDERERGSDHFRPRSNATRQQREKQ